MTTSPGSWPDQGHRSHHYSWKNAVQGWGLEAFLSLGVGVGHWRSGGGSLPIPVPQAQWECVNAKYKQKKRHYKNSGVVILADLKVSCGPCLRTPHLPTVGRGLAPTSTLQRANKAGARPSLRVSPLSDGP